MALLPPEILSQSPGVSPPQADSQLARALMSQAAPVPSVGAGTNPLGGLSIQQMMDIKKQMGAPPVPGTPQSGVSQFFNGTNTADPYSGAPYNDGSGMWDKIAQLFQGAGGK